MTKRMTYHGQPFGKPPPAPEQKPEAVENTCNHCSEAFTYSYVCTICPKCFLAGHRFGVCGEHCKVTDASRAQAELVTRSLLAAAPAPAAQKVCAQCETNARDNEAGGYNNLAKECREYCRRGHKPAPQPVSEPPYGTKEWIALTAERLIGDLEYGCAAKFDPYRPAALAIARAYLRRQPDSAAAPAPAQEQETRK